MSWRCCCGCVGRELLHGSTQGWQIQCCRKRLPGSPLSQNRTLLMPFCMLLGPVEWRNTHAEVSASCEVCCPARSRVWRLYTLTPGRVIWEACVPALCRSSGQPVSTKTSSWGRSTSAGDRTCYPIDQLTDSFISKAQTFFGQEVEG